MNSLNKIVNDLISFETLKKVKQLILIFFNILGFNAFFRFINRNKLTILLFHGISNENFSFHNRRYLPKSIFEKIILYLKRKNYVFITMSDWLKIIERDKKIKHSYVIITFDDGLKSVVENAYPIMKKLGAKGCFYIISDILGKNQFVWTDHLEVFLGTHKTSYFEFKFEGEINKYLLNSENDIQKAYSNIKNQLRVLPNKNRLQLLKQFELPMDNINFEKDLRDYLVIEQNDLRVLNKNYLEVGGHTKTHPLLKYIEDDEYYDELFMSKKKLGEIIGYDIHHLCYPGGSYNEKIIQLTKNYGYKTGVLIEQGFNTLKTDIYRLKRINVENNYIVFKYKLSGLYFFLKKYLNIELL